MDYKESLTVTMQELVDNAVKTQTRLEELAREFCYVPSINIDPYDLADAIRLMDGATNRLKNILRSVEESK